MNELKPCPFCGEKEFDDYEIDGGPAIRCEYCGAIGPWADTYQGAKELWNERKNE